MENKDVQKIVKMTIQYAKEIIKPGMSHSSFSIFSTQ